MKKTIEITDAKSFLELKLNKLGSYLKFKKPLAINWSDCAGSIAQFYAIFSFSQEYKNSIDESLRLTLNEGNFQFDSGIKDVTKLLTLFENGTYNVSFEPNYKLEISDSWNWDLAKNHKPFTSNPIIRKEIQKEYSDNKAHLNTLTESYYDGYSEYFICTQPFEKLDKQRIRFYEEQIIKGKKPVSIIYSGYSQRKKGSKWIRTHRSGNFIIDGHHKLVAYKNLKKTPSLLRIEKVYQSEKELNFSDKDLNNDLKDKLLKCQLRHFDENYKKQ